MWLFVTDQSYQLLGDWPGWDVDVPVGDENRSDVIDCVKVRLLYHLMDQADAVQTTAGYIWLQ